MGMGTFIRVAEVWTPSEDGSLLELSGGIFDAAPAFGAISRSMCFGRAEGLPGSAWDEGRPLLLRRLENPGFRRAAAARAAGLACAIALPIFVGERLTSVVVLLCADSDQVVGAIELWRNDPRVESDLRLADGWFGATDPALEVLSRDSFLPRGQGLPGLAWQRDAAVFIADIAGSRQFLRGPAAAGAGIAQGLALPCSTRTHQTWVLSLLSAPQSPIARRIEVWQPDRDGRGLQRAFGHCENAGTLPADPAGAAPAAALGPIGRAWTHAAAQVAGSEDAVGKPWSRHWPEAGLRSVLAIPRIADEGVGEVVALYF